MKYEITDSFSITNPTFGIWIESQNLKNVLKGFARTQNSLAAAEAKMKESPTGDNFFDTPAEFLFENSHQR